MNQTQTLPNTYRRSARPSSLARNAMLALVNRIPRGKLLVREHGLIVAESRGSKEELYAEIDVLDPRFYRAALLGGGTGAGEAYTRGWWSTPDMTRVIRLFARNMDFTDRWEARFRWLKKPVDVLTAARRRNTVSKAKDNILAHYDLGNELYSAFLDERMQYSSGLYLNDDDTLEQAQDSKLRRICEELELGPEDHLLEIGTGWGGLAIYAAENYGCRVTTTTISEAQYQLASERVARHGLTDRITLLTKDYRELDGRFDKIVSVEMIEAVGREFLPAYFRQLESLLLPGGRILLQAITIADQRYDRYASRMDFIRKHVFPGGHLLSIEKLAEHFADHTGMVIRNLRDMGEDYARTISDWRDRFLTAREELDAAGYDERFFRLWLYYLGFCEGGFRERHISVVQLTAAR